MAETIINSFDLNCTAVGIDLLGDIVHSPHLGVPSSRDCAANVMERKHARIRSGVDRGSDIVAGRDDRMSPRGRDRAADVADVGTDRGVRVG